MACVAVAVAVLCLALPLGAATAERPALYNERGTFLLGGWVLPDEHVLISVFEGRRVSQLPVGHPFASINGARVCVTIISQSDHASGCGETSRSAFSVSGNLTSAELQPTAVRICGAGDAGDCRSVIVSMTWVPVGSAFHVREEGEGFDLSSGCPVDFETRLLIRHGNSVGTLDGRRLEDDGFADQLQRGSVRRTLRSTCP